MPPRSRMSLVLLLVLMDLLGGFSVVIGSNVLKGAGVPPELVWLLFVCGCFGVLVAGLRDALELPEPWDRVAEVCGAIPCLLIGLAVLTHQPKPLFIGELAICAIYWRGMVLGGQVPNLEQVQGHFGLGFAAVFFGVVWAVARGDTNDPELWQTLAIVGIGYTCTAMLALALARMEREPGTTGSVASALALELGTLMILSVAALGFFSYDVGGWLVHLTQPFWTVVGPAVAALLHVLLYPLLWITEHLRSHAHPVPIKSPLQQLIPRQHTGTEPQASSPGIWATVLGIGVGTLLLVGVSYLLWRVLPHRRSRQIDEKQDEIEGEVLTPRAVWQSLLAWLRHLFSRGSDSTTRSLGGVTRRVLGPTYPTDPIRRVYAQLLYRAGTQGLPRSQSATPLEYLQDLSRRWPTGGREFALITEAYMLRRYGEVSLDSHEIEELKQIWRRLRLLMREPIQPG